MAQRLDKRPLIVDSLLQQLRIESTRTIHGLLPQPLEDVPRLAETLGVVRLHLRALRIAAIELRLDERPDVHSVHLYVFDLPVDLDIHHQGSPDPRARQVDVANAGVREIDTLQPCSLQVDILEPGAGQVFFDEVRHLNLR